MRPVVPILIAVALAGATRAIAGGPALDEALVASGRVIYEASCAPCHGFTGNGDGSAARWLEPRPRDFTRGAFKFRSTESGALPTDADILRVVDVGVPGTAMPGWRAKLGEDERRAVVAYVKTLSPRFARARRPPEERPVTPPPPDTPQLRWEGQQLFRLFRCAQCHGRGGRGDGPAAATTHDDWGRPIRPADLVVGPLRSGGRPIDVFRVLDTGINGTPMPAYSQALLVGREALSSLTEILAESGAGARPDLERFVTSMPTQAELDALSEEARVALASRRLWALATYVVGLGRPHGFSDWLFGDQPGRYPDQ